MKCGRSPHYFIHHYCQLYHPPGRRWIPFQLWPAQSEALATIIGSRLVAILKARQLGLTWLVVAFALWQMIFRPGSVILFFSRRDHEASQLIERLRGMHQRLPVWLQASLAADKEHEFTFAQLGSVAHSFSTTKHSGRSFAASLAIIDEADFIPWIRQLLVAVKPTVDAGGRLVAISTANKETPQSEFKRIWKAGHGGESQYQAVFLPWSAHPDRDRAWYRAQAGDFAPDDLHQEYPATPEQALSPRRASARFDPDHLAQCHQPAPPIPDSPPVPVPGLVVYEAPKPGGQYVISADPAEGDPNSDPSAAIVWDGPASTEVAHLWGRFEPTAFSSYLGHLAQWYQGAVICVERNNHGHAVHVALKAADVYHPLYRSPFDSKDGWLSNLKYKTLAVDHAAQVFQTGGCVIRTPAVIAELSGIQASTEGGRVSCTNVGACTYRGPAGFCGTDTFTYTISDGNGGTDAAIVTVTVIPVNEPPTAVDDSATANENSPVEIEVLENDTDPDGDQLTLSQYDTSSTQGGAVNCTSVGVCTYTPPPGFRGSDTFRYTVSDGNGGTDTATVTIFVASPAPIPAGVHLSEILSAPAAVDWDDDGSADDRDEWIELANAGSTAIDLGGWFLAVDGNSSELYMIPPETVLQPGAFMLFYRRETGIVMDDDGGEVWLIAPDGEAIDAVVFGRLRPDASYSLGRDGVWHDDWPPSPGEANSPAGR